MSMLRTWRQFVASKTALALAVLCGELLFAFFIFHAGVSFGEWQTLERIHPERHPQAGFGFLPPGFIPEGHGAVGTIATITPPTFTLEERDGDEETVRISTSTSVRNHATTIDVGELRSGEEVIVIGDPDGGVIDARLIHIIANY